MSLAVCKDKIQKNHLIHKLVAKAFIDNPNNYDSINHKDEDKNYGTRNKRMSETIRKKYADERGVKNGIL